MVIKASSADEIRRLVDALSGTDEMRRDAAAARLSVIGPRAVARLLAAYARATSGTTRLTILRILEPIGDPRALAPARHALQENGEMALSAIQILRGLLDAPDDAVRADALDTLARVALDRHSTLDARRMAIDAVESSQALPEDVRARVQAALDADGLTLRQKIETPAEPTGQPEAVWQEALEGRLPAGPQALREVLVAAARTAPLTSLQRLVDALRAKETGDEHQEDWRVLRGAVHQALGQRDSRVALYDLRESLTSATTPLPVSFLSAVNALGDRTCLEPLAHAYAAASAAETWWRQQLATAFRAIVAREKLTRRSAPLKKIAARWPASDLLP